MLALQEASSPTNVYVPQHRPSKLDRITLIATGTMKAHEIGTEVRYYLVYLLHFEHFIFEKL